MKNKVLYYLLPLLFLYSCQKDDVTYKTEVQTSEVEFVSFVDNEGTANVGGKITSEGRPTIKKRGIEWSTESDFSANVQSASDNVRALGDFICVMIGLKQRTTYYVRAFAQNSYGIIFGQVQSITTPALPVVVTSDIEYTTGLTLKSGGEITDNGGSEIIARGICWGEDFNIDVTSNHTTDGTGIGKFESELLDLTPGTTYYVRAYATSAYGTGYGEVKSVTTHGYPKVVTKEVSQIQFTSAVCGGKITDFGGTDILSCGVCYAQSPKEPTIEDEHTEDVLRDSVFTSTMSGLSEGITYNARAYAVNSIGIVYGEVVTFQTDYHLPTVVTASATNINATFATCGGEVTSDGGNNVTERGVCYSTSQNPTTSDNKETSGSGTGAFTCSLTGLSKGTTYYVRAYAVNGKGVAYGEQKTFTTSTTEAIVTTNNVTNVAATSATCGGNVTSDGGATVTERGVCYSTSQNPTTSNTKVTSGSGTGAFTCSLTGLNKGTTYYVRAYAVNSKGTAYGEQKTFTTNATEAIVTTNNVTNVAATSATCGGNVTSDGGATVTERGVCYSTSQNPTTSNTKVTSGSGTGAFTCSLTGLNKGTTYYVRAYAINSKGTAYGEQKTFTTSTTEATVTTGNVSNITATSATCGGNVTSDGGATVTERGVCYSTSQNPTTSSSKVTSGSGTGAFTCNLTGLQLGTTYYVRAYAVNGKGVAYGEQKTFTTSTTEATVTTSNVTNITATSATCGGNVTSDGGAAITERGVCYSTSQNPTTSNTRVTSGSGMGAFTCNLTGLQLGTTYYVRAYAVNSKGTAYGVQVTFTTASNAIVTTNNVTNIAATSATCGGNVTSDGGATVTERGVCYSSSEIPTTSSAKVTSGSGTGAFTCNLTGLNMGTRYYYRAYAVNSNGTAYGGMKSFTTTIPAGALNGQFSVSATKKVLFSKGNLQFNAAQGSHQCADGTTKQGTWRFAENQDETIGSTQITQMSQTYNGWIDLYAWGTSGWNSGAVMYFPWSLGLVQGNDYYNFYVDGNGNNDLTGAYAYADWGVYNAIENGGNAPNLWRTLTHNEWMYLLNQRVNYDNLRTAATINGVQGLLLFPDDLQVHDFQRLIGINIVLTTDASANVFTITPADWEYNVAHFGIVFLPRTGEYSLSGGNNGWNGYASHYWTTTHANNRAVYSIKQISTTSTDFSHNRYRCDSGAVRLVQDIDD